MKNALDLWKDAHGPRFMTLLASQGCHRDLEEALAVVEANLRVHPGVSFLEVLSQLMGDREAGWEESELQEMYASFTLLVDGLLPVVEVSRDQEMVILEPYPEGGKGGWQELARVVRQRRDRVIYLLRGLHAAGRTPETLPMNTMTQLAYLDNLNENMLRLLEDDPRERAKANLGELAAMLKMLDGPLGQLIEAAEAGEEVEMPPFLREMLEAAEDEGFGE